MKFMFALLLLVTVNLQAQPITLTAQDGFKLHTSYFQGMPGKPGVLMLHQCNEERSMYDELGKKLSSIGFHALSLDFRMYGDSVTAEVDIKKLSALVDARSQINQVRQLWPNDVLLAHQLLREKIGENAPIGIVGASCGGRQAIELAKVKAIKALLLFSSSMNAETQMLYLGLNNIATFFIAAEQDQFTYNGAKIMFDKSTHSENRMLSYKGDGHGLPLFKQDLGLVNNMVSWFEKQLSK